MSTAWRERRREIIRLRISGELPSGYTASNVPKGTEHAFSAGVSWDDAQREAKRWIDGLNLQNVRGACIDLRGPAEKLSFQGHFRVMVFQAAKRLLKKRGAAVILPGDDA